VIEGGVPRMSHELERPARQIRQGSLVDPAPIDSELLFRGDDGIGQELQDVFGRHPWAR
jgi:hypothetical protein